MTYPADSNFDRRDPPYRIEPRAPHVARGAAREEWADQEPEWAERAAPPAARGQRRSRIGRLLLWLVVAVVVLGAVAGGAFVANRLGWLDLPMIGGTGGRVSLGPARSARGEAEVVFSGRASDLVAAPGNVVQEDTSVSPPAVWLRSSLRSASPAGATDGIALKVPDALVPRIEGRTVRVTVTARTGGQGEPSPFAVAYSAGDRGNSGWFVFTPTSAMEDYSFSYRVPIGEMENPANTHLIGIWSDIAGNNAPLSIRRITIEPQ